MSRRKRDLSLRVRLFRTMFLAGIFLLFVSTAFPNQPPPDAALVGSEACLDCHEEIGAAFSKTMHGVAFSKNGSGGALTFESCQGPGSSHLEESDPALIIDPADRQT